MLRICDRMLCSRRCNIYKVFSYQNSDPPSRMQTADGRKVWRPNKKGGWNAETCKQMRAALSSPCCNLNEIGFTAFGSSQCPDSHVDMAASNYDRTAAMRCTLPRGNLRCPIRNALLQTRSSRTLRTERQPVRTARMRERGRCGSATLPVPMTSRIPKQARGVRRARGEERVEAGAFPAWPPVRVSPAAK